MSYWDDGSTAGGTPYPFRSSTFLRVFQSKWYEDLNNYNPDLMNQLLIKLKSFETEVMRLISLNPVEVARTYANMQEVIFDASWGLSHIVMTFFEKMKDINHDFVFLRSVFKAVKRFLIESPNMSNKDSDNINLGAFSLVYQAFNTLYPDRELVIPETYRSRIRSFQEPTKSM